ncbi:hypothetical protein B0H16DRAFT_1468300 [Mycena metata]|uniref:Alpha-type protein kinase domain-containing protein n=1 Tax=Mycena metata TaxID=1033252 RepID=A0AAD7I1I7_9AGAR|nr:hypothetical protein B0H16DRAFT_1468300 [Mycena metata]
MLAQEAELTCEVVQDSGPSTASGVSLEQYQVTQRTPTPKTPNQSPNTLLILVKDLWCGFSNQGDPARSTGVEQMNTSLGPQQTGEYIEHIRSLYIVSHESTVFCDLQTQTVVNEDGKGMEVLFDVMTHTLDGGVGDHGKTGIQILLKKYNCVQCFDSFDFPVHHYKHS